MRRGTPRRSSPCLFDTLHTIVVWQEDEFNELKQPSSSIHLLARGRGVMLDVLVCY